MDEPKVNEEVKFTAAPVVAKEGSDTLDMSKPASRYKDNTGTYWAQNGSVYSMGGNRVLSNESTKAQIWDVQATPMGKLAVAKAGLTVEQSAVKEELEKEGQVFDFQCPDCPNGFETNKSLNMHRTRVHRAKPSELTRD